MIVIAAFILGAIWGGLSAKKRKGNAMDIAQYATVYGIACAIVSMFALIIIGR